VSDDLSYKADSACELVMIDVVDGPDDLLFIVYRHLF